MKTDQQELDLIEQSLAESLDSSSPLASPSVPDLIDEFERRLIAMAVATGHEVTITCRPNSDGTVGFEAKALMPRTNSIVEEVTAPSRSAIGAVRALFGRLSALLNNDRRNAEELAARAHSRWVLLDTTENRIRNSYTTDRDTDTEEKDNDHV